MKRQLKRLLLTLGYHVQGIRYQPKQLLEPACVRRIELDDLVKRRMFEYGQELRFIQIGAFDGITKDPLRNYIAAYGWRGVFVEPQPVATGRLRALYRGNDQLIVLEAALDRQTGRRTLFTVESSAAPTWAAGMASFDRAHIAKHATLIANLEQMIQEVTVDCVTFDEVFTAYPFDRLDVLQIDAEGADAAILSWFPFHRAKPAIIHWEVKNLSMVARHNCLARLIALGYRVCPSGDEDMLATTF